MWFFNKNKKVNIASAGWLQGFMDIHCHLVPAVDDGSRSVEDTRAIISSMKEVGITAIITTPHIHNLYSSNNYFTLKEAYEKASPELADMQIPLYLAAEYMMDEFFDEHLKEPLLTLGTSRYLLVETHLGGAAVNLYENIYKVFEADAMPIMAHPERYTYMDMSDYAKMCDAGCSLQLNLFSLSGAYGSRVQKRATELLEGGYYTFVGTDTHRPEAFRHVLDDAELPVRMEPLLRKLIENNNKLITL